jgi:5-methyltetrahydropteroyltriglutamate--homocysteine methyltransferase
MSSGPAHIRLSSTGSYPRVSDNPESQLLERTAVSFDRGERTSADLLDAQNTVTRRAISDQVKAGLEIITDGQIRWNDPISHLAAKLDNVSLQDSLPFFGTQKYFRQPICCGKPVRRGALIVDEYSFARNALGHLATPPGKAGKLAIKPVLTGPYTLAKLSVSEAHAGNGARDRAGLEERVLAYAEILALEIDALAQSGAHLVQIDEPAILAHPEDWAIFEAAMTRLAESCDTVRKAGRKLDLALYSYFGDASPLYRNLIALPVEILGLDFVSSPALLETIVSVGAPKSLALGLVDGRNSKMENVTDVAKRAGRLLPKIAGGQVFLGTSCGLEYLTADIAFAKLAFLTTVLAELTGTLKIKA